MSRLAVPAEPDAGEPVDRDALLARLPALAAAIAPGAARRDLERELPFAAFDEVRASRIGTLRLPRHLGGPGGTVEDYIEAIAAIAAADSNVAHALRSHFNQVEGQILLPSEAQDQQIIRHIREGRLFAGAHTELGGDKPNEFQTRLTREGDHYRLNGRKWYATGTAFADIATFTAVNEAGDLTGVLLPLDREGIVVLDDWDGMGQRLTASGGVLLQNVLVHPGEIRTRAREGQIGRHTSTLRQLHLAACAGGIVRNVLADAVDFVRNHARAANHSPAASAREDHFVHQVIGQIAAASFAIDASLKASAQALDRSAATLLQGGPEAQEAALIESSLATSRTQIVIAELGLKATERLFETGGGSATSRRHNFDRHWRNLRTVLNHNPLLHKTRVVGDFYLNGTTTHLREGLVF